MLRKSSCLVCVLSLSLGGVFLGEAALGETAVAKVEKSPSEQTAAHQAPQYVPRFAFRRDGRWIQSGLRLERSGDSLLIGSESFLAGGEAQGLELPAHLGGGFLFYQAVADGGVSATAIYRATSWTSPLVPLVRVPFPVEFIEPGFDRLYLLGVSVHVALDVESGNILPLDPLPPVVSIQNLSFSGPRRALLEAPIIGTLYTRDAGLSWQPIRESLSVESSLNGEGLFVRTAAGSQLVREDGSLSTPVPGRHFPISLRARGPVSDSSNSPVSEVVLNESAEAELTRDARERALVQTVTQGVLLPKSAAAPQVAVSLSEGSLYRLSLGRSLELSAQPILPTAEGVTATDTCFGVPGVDAEQLPLFVCRGTETKVVRLEARPESWSKRDAGALLRTLYRSKSLVPVLAYGDGGVFVASECSGASVSPAKDQDRSACLITAKGLFPVQIPSPKTVSPGTSLSFAADAQQVWQVWLEREKSRVHAQSLWRAPSPPGATGTRANSARSWQVPKDAAIEEFFESGNLLPLASRDGEELLLWATSRELFVGFRLGDAKSPTFGAVQRPLKRAIFDGPRAMIWGAAGFAKQSVDGGLHFTEASYPYRSGDAELSHVVAPSSAVEMGCGPAGCTLGRLVRFGWDEGELEEAKLPPAVPLSPRGGQRFRFTCHSGLADTKTRLAEGTAVFSSFWEQPAPTLAAGEEGVSVPFSQEFGRLYAWGPQETSWTRKGGAELRFFDPWSPEKIRNTAKTPHLFESSLQAQEGMGLLDRISGSRAIVFDPSGDRGAFVLRTRDKTELYTFFEGAPLEHVKGAEELELRNLRSVVFARGSWFLAFQQNSSLAVARVSAGELELLAQFPLGDAASRDPDLVRTVAGDLGVSVVGDAGLLVYPLSEQGELGSPILVDEKSQRPEFCAREASGFITDVDLSLTPYLETASERPIKVSSMKARMIVGHGAPCIEALLANTREDISVSGTTATKVSVPLSLLNVDSHGDRKVLSCE